MYRELQPEHKVNPEGFPEGLVYISPYIPLLIILQIQQCQTFSISKRYNSRIVLLGRAILEELTIRIALAAGAIFSGIGQQMKQYGSIQKKQRTLMWDHQEYKYEIVFTASIFVLRNTVLNRQTMTNTFNNTYLRGCRLKNKNGSGPRQK